MAQSFLFALAFALYVVLATWALILFHLRREMEENYLIKHSSQAPSQKVGVEPHPQLAARGRGLVPGQHGAGRAGGVRRLGGDVRAGAAHRRRLRAREPAREPQHGRLLRRGRAGPVRHPVDRQPGRRAARDHPARSPRSPADRQRDREIEQLYWRGTVYDTYDSGHWVRRGGRMLRTQLEEHGTRYLIHEPRFEAPHPTRRRPLPTGSARVAAPSPTSARPRGIRQLRPTRTAARTR